MEEEKKGGGGGGEKKRRRNQGGSEFKSRRMTNLAHIYVMDMES